MRPDFEIRQIPLTLPGRKKMLAEFLSSSGLQLGDVSYYAGIFSISDDRLVAGGGLCRNVIQSVAVDPQSRDEGLAAPLISHLLSVAAERGHQHVKVFTKPENVPVFSSLSFRLLARTDEAVLMETGPGGLDRYLSYLRSLAPDGNNGVIVMNANPFTRGHRYLVEQASRQVDRLFVIAVKEDASLFSSEERLAMIREGCAGLPNVTVCEGSEYAVSAATFPTYFLKEPGRAAEIQMRLDLDLYRRHIAPALQAGIRFAGSEPCDALTRRYNELMPEMLPEVRIIPRLEDKNGPVSASRLRDCLAAGRFEAAKALAWPSSIPYLIAHLATRALQRELDLDPKPGLVSPSGSGAHKDMDYALMQKSIDALHPWFVHLARFGFNPETVDAGAIRLAGQAAESDMLSATGGVNTHRGALFALGLAVVAVAQDNAGRREGPDRRISRLARSFPDTSGTHGSRVRARFGVPGALDLARTGYRILFDDWLPFYRSRKDGEDGCLQTLLHILATLDDTNILFRKGPAVAHRVKEQAARLLADYTRKGMEELCETFTRDNISPGGCADMLALTLFMDSIIP